MILSSFKEAIVDTGIAVIINVPINFVLLYYADQKNYSVSETTLFLTVAFTAIAIFRKTIVGTFFKINTKES
jgi:hypothetical protein